MFGHVKGFCSTSFMVQSNCLMEMIKNELNVSQIEECTNHEMKSYVLSLKNYHIDIFWNYANKIVHKKKMILMFTTYLKKFQKI